MDDQKEMRIGWLTIKEWGIMGLLATYATITALDRRENELYEKPGEGKATRSQVEERANSVGNVDLEDSVKFGYRVNEPEVPYRLPFQNDQREKAVAVLPGKDGKELVEGFVYDLFKRESGNPTPYRANSRFYSGSQSRRVMASARKV